MKTKISVVVVQWMGETGGKKSHWSEANPMRATSTSTKFQQQKALLQTKERKNQKLLLEEERNTSASMKTVNAHHFFRKSVDFGSKLPLFSCGFLHCFLRGRFQWTNLDIFCVYVGEGKKQEHKHNLSAHDSKMADAVANFHPTSCISYLISIEKKGWVRLLKACDNMKEFPL